MAEAAAPVAVAEPVAVAAPAVGRGRGRGKAKGRGKFKGKVKGKKAMKAVPAADDGEPKPKKEPKKSLRQQVEEEVGDRNIEDVIKEMRAQVEELQANVAKAQEGEVMYETHIMEGKVAMEAASAKVDEVVHKETLALEKFKAAQQALMEAKKIVLEKKLALGDEDKALEVLSSEGEKSKAEADIIAAREAAAAAKEAARKALEEAKAKEKQIIEEMKSKKNALALTDDPEAEKKAKEAAERAAEEARMRKEAKDAGKNAAGELKAQLKELERQRAARDKERAQAFKMAAGLGKPSKRLAIGDGAGASPAKAAKIQDVD